MSKNISEKSVLMITCSHSKFFKDWKDELLGEESDKLLNLSKKNLNKDKCEELLNNKYEIIIIQWHNSLKESSVSLELLPKIKNTLKKSLENSGTIIHLFEQIKKGEVKGYNKDIAEIINQVLQETSPAQYCMKKNKYYTSSLKKGYKFKVTSDSYINTTHLVDSLNNGIIKGFSTLNKIDEHVVIHIASISEEHPILLSKQIDNGNSIALAFSFCGDWNRQEAGFSKFQSLIFNEIVRVQYDNTKLKLEKDISKENIGLSITVKPEEEPIKIIETEKEQSINSSGGHKDGIEEVDLLSDVENDIEVLEAEEGHGIEGNIKYYYGRRYERNINNRVLAIKKHGLNCFACGFNFEKVYGEHGTNFIEVHHIIPLSTLEEAVEINPETDLIPLCSNCHRMVHRRKDNVLSVDELKQIIKK